MAQKLIVMTQKELLKYEIITDLIKGKINGTAASKQLSLSVRQVKNLKAKVKKLGAKGIIHASRGRESNRRIKPEIIEKAKKYLKKKYHDFGPKFASEKLEENHKIKLGKETVRQIMASIGLWKPKPRKQPKNRHTWRPRKDYYGEMQQFDGSYHHWLEDRSGELCLLLSVDDATGKITHAKFDYHEGVLPVFKFWLEYFKKNGLPLSIYLDKFSTYKINHRNAKDNQELITQFGRAMNQAGTRLITAHSPEAKGRVERMFGTFQNRLVKEMRLVGISTIEEANEFLKKYIPKFNAQFEVIPRKRNNLHRKINKELDKKLPQIFSIQEQRIVHNDYTVMFKNQYFQLDEEQPTTVYKKDQVIIEEHLNNEVKINLKGHYLNYQVLPERPKKQINVKLPALTRRKQSGWKPPLDHPWRRKFIFNNKLKVEKPAPILINKNR